MSRAVWTLSVLIVAAVVLGYCMGSVGIAGEYVDPVGKILAQDEAVYSHTAIRMAGHGGWLTPMFLGRYAFYKPPLLYWASGVSAKFFGVSPFSLRLPSLLAAALATALAFRWVTDERGLIAGLAAALLIVSNHLWHTLARLNLMDMLLAMWIGIAIFVLAKEPSLETRWAFWAFAGALAAAIMTKAVAGVVPALVLLAVQAIAGLSSWRRVAAVTAAAGLLALPWHLYQIVAHPRWFWAEYIQTELFAYGMAPPYQTSQENPLVFYCRRALSIDPVLFAAALISTPAFVSACRKRSPRALVLLAWIAVTVATVLSFQYRNAAYLLPLVSAAAIIVAVYGPLTATRRRAALTCAVLAVVFAVKAVSAGTPWGLPFQSGTKIASAAALEAYAREGRGRELIIIAPDDEFVSSVLAIPRVRYCAIDPAERRPSVYLDVRSLGIMVSAAQFRELDRWQPVFEQRLKEWGLDSAAPIATVIVAPSEEEVLELIRSRPRVDFLAPERFGRAVRETGSHEVRKISERLFLLARS